MRWLVTGAAGFIGTNVCEFLVERGDAVLGVDDLSRGGVDANRQHLEQRFGLAIARVDVSDVSAFQVFADRLPPVDAVVHLAGQVSLMESINNPRRDFEINALGTLNVLEYVRLRSPETTVIGLSSNKIYGDLADILIEETSTRYVAPDFPRGFPESLPLDFHGPYGCSKGAADQYLKDYGRVFGLRTVSLRQSSVYGPHQHPRADQGWLSFFVKEALAGRPVQLNGHGKQVRDLLHVRDFARLMPALAETAPTGGTQLNVGGGPTRALSILELFGELEDRDLPLRYQSGPERPSDQRVFIADTAKAEQLTGWRPTIGVAEGLEQLIRGGRGS